MNVCLLAIVLISDRMRLDLSEVCYYGGRSALPTQIIEFSSVHSHEIKYKFASSLHSSIASPHYKCSITFTKKCLQATPGGIGEESYNLFDALCEGKASLHIEIQLIHSKTHLKSYYVEKCLRSRKLAEGKKISSSAIVYFASLHGEAVDMENFLQILQRTMKILGMPGRLSTILMADIKTSNSS